MAHNNFNGETNLRTQAILNRSNVNKRSKNMPSPMTMSTVYAPDLRQHPTTHKHNGGAMSPISMSYNKMADYNDQYSRVVKPLPNANKQSTHNFLP